MAQLHAGLNSEPTKQWLHNMLGDARPNDYCQKKSISIRKWKLVCYICRLLKFSGIGFAALAPPDWCIACGRSKLGA